MLLRRSLLLFALGCASCSTDDATGSGGADGTVTQETFVGAVAGTDVRLSLVRDGEALALFFCGGADSYATSTKWIRSSAPGPAYDLGEGGWKATFSVEGTSATGTVDRGVGVPLAWSAALVDEAGLAGLYEAEEQDGRVGVVVTLDEAGQPVVQGALVTATIAAQVVPIAPVERVSDRLRVQVLLAEPKNLTVRRAVAVQ